MIKYKNIYSVVKTVKSRTSLDLSCDENMPMLDDDGPLSQVKAVEKKLHIKSSEKIDETLTNEELQTAGEMFIYLTMCPYTKPWIVFYKDLFLAQSPDQIILTLNRVMKGSVTATQTGLTGLLSQPTNKYIQKLAEILLKRIKK